MSVQQKSTSDVVKSGIRRSMAAAILAIALGSLVAGCIVVPAGPPRYYHPYYRYY